MFTFLLNGEGGSADLALELCVLSITYCSSGAGRLSFILSSSQLRFTTKALKYKYFLEKPKLIFNINYEIWKKKFWRMKKIIEHTLILCSALTSSRLMQRENPQQLRESQRRKYRPVASHCQHSIYDLSCLCDSLQNLPSISVQK